MQDIRNTSRYKQWAKEIKKRDKNTCRRCGIKRNLHAHHIKPRGIYPELKYELANGLTLCGNCHNEITHREEDTNLYDFIEECPYFYNGHTAKALKATILEQLRVLNAEFYHYLAGELGSNEGHIRNAAVDSLFAQLYTYPYSLEGFLPLIERNFQTMEQYFRTALIQLMLPCDEFLNPKIRVVLQTLDSEDKSAKTYFRWGYTKAELRQLLVDGFFLQQRKQ